MPFAEMRGILIGDLVLQAVKREAGARSSNNGPARHHTSQFSCTAEPEWFGMKL